MVQTKRKIMKQILALVVVVVVVQVIQVIGSSLVYAVCNKTKCNGFFFLFVSFRFALFRFVLLVINICLYTKWISVCRCRCGSMCRMIGNLIGEIHSICLFI